MARICIRHQTWRKKAVRHLFVYRRFCIRLSKKKAVRHRPSHDNHNTSSQAPNPNMNSTLGGSSKPPTDGSADEAYAELARVRATVLKYKPEIGRTLQMMELASRSTGSDSMRRKFHVAQAQDLPHSMPDNVRMARVRASVEDMAEVLYSLMAELGINEKTPTCCLCAKPCDCPYGHDPQPLDSGEDGAKCCSNCNSARVIPARMGMTMKKARTDA